MTIGRMSRSSCIDECVGSMYDSRCSRAWRYIAMRFFFFFSSRRLHTRCSRDWSSYVCSSDLIYDRDVVWLNDPSCYPVWKKAEQLGGVFNIFLAPHQVRQIADMAQRFPGVNVVVDHMAMIDITAPDSDGFGPLLDLAKFPNVYARTSLHNPSKTKQPPFRDVWPFLRRLYDRFGPRRMIWANFFELLIMKELIPVFTADDKEWILGRTSHRLYRLQARSGARRP